MSREKIVERNLDPYDPRSKDASWNISAPPPPPAELERKIVKNARLDFEVDSFENAYKRVVAIAREEGGFVANSSTTKLPNGKVRGQVTVRVPAANFDNVTLKLRALGDLKNQNISTQDVTKQYVDLASKLKSKNALEARLLKLLEEGKGPVKELLQVEKELGRLREEIDAVQGELKYLESIVSLSTITLNLAERDIEQPFEYVKTVSANVGVVADDAKEAFNKAHDIVKEAKGQILDARMTRDKNDAATATIRAAVDADKFPAVLEQMKELGKVTEATVNHEQKPVGGSNTKAAPDAPVRKEQAHIELTITTPIEVVTVVGEFAVETGDAGAAYEAARKAIKEAGGTILGGKMSHQVDSSGGYVNAKIEAARFSSLAEALKKLGDVKVASVNQNDPPENAKIRTEMGTLQFRVVTPRVLIESGEGIGAMIRDTIEWGFKGILWSLKAIVVGLAYVGPWALVAMLIIWLVRRARRRHASA